jgi:hypothetical protein
MTAHFVCSHRASLMVNKESAGSMNSLISLVAEFVRHLHQPEKVFSGARRQMLPHRIA